MSSATKICQKSIAEISGTFLVKDYQRGYRWTKPQVKRLLSDIWECIKTTGDKYFLQPVVVTRNNESYELIDGQQRLTTLYLALSYADMLVMGKQPENYTSRVSFKLNYETRPESAKFLAKLGYGFKPEDNIDFYYMHHALEEIKDWFVDKNISESNATDFYCDVRKIATILWYEIDTNNTSVTPEDIFIRLNSGKIPLTNAELLRAWFLSGEKGPDENETELKSRRLTIGLQWDNMEHELADKSFWAFITNNSQEDYATKIDLIMEMAVWDKGYNPSKDADDYAVFYAFLKENAEEKNDKFALWKKIQLNYQRMRHWYDDKELYNKLGYLITSGCRTMPAILIEAKTKGAEDLKKYVVASITESLKDVTSLEDVSYNNAKLAERVLLLFNVLSVLGNADYKDDNFLSMDRYPFAIHKSKKNAWSLEHVLAQNDVGLRTKTQWDAWIADHRRLFKDVEIDVEKYYPQNDGEKTPDAINKINEQFKNVVATFNEWDNINPGDEKNLGRKFEEITTAVAGFFETVQGTDGNDIHNLGNLALLTLRDNSILSNDVFEVKRHKIIELDKEGKFIPLCTKRLFMRYYSNNKINAHLPYWSLQDRAGYIKAIAKTLDEYLTLNQKEENSNA